MRRYENTEQYYQALRDAGHELILDENNNVDAFIFEYDIHNGPGCSLCGDGWCQHCMEKVYLCPNKKKMKCLRVKSYSHDMNTESTQSTESLGSPLGYPSLWELLIMADEGNAIEAHPQDADELTKLHERGVVRGKKWIRLTDRGKKLRDAVLLG